MPAAPERPTRPAAFDAEALTHVGEVLGYARSLTRDPSDAEDLTQDTFLQAFRHWDQYQLDTKMGAWLFTICRHLFVRQRDRSLRQQPVDDAELESLAAAAVHATVIAADPVGRFFETPELDEVIRQEMEKLPREYREVVALSDLHDQSYADIARVLGVPVGTVKSRLFRGRRLLQEALVDYARDAGLLPMAGGGS
jgi:RNA polymerase sigma-70 factor (ECF subfamily)